MTSGLIHGHVEAFLTIGGYRRRPEFEDLRQDIELVCLRLLHTFDPRRGSLGTWVWLTARRTLFNQRRAANRKAAWLGSSGNLESMDREDRDELLAKSPSAADWVEAIETVRGISEGKRDSSCARQRGVR
jgi:DNA-directed RNA polymerase specialized sigma24 family protein